MKSFVITFLAAMIIYLCLPDTRLLDGIDKFDINSVNQIPDNNNLFNAIAGFTSAPGKFPLSEGARLVRMANQSLEEFSKSGKAADEYPGPVFDPHWQKPALKASDDINLLCDPRMRTCLDIWEAQQQIIENSLLENAVLLSRYQQMQQYTAYYNGLSPDIRSPIPELSSLISINRLYGIMYAMLYLSGSHEAAVSGLNRDIIFVRRLLQQANTMLVKMVALSMLKHDMYVYETLMDVPATNNYFSETIPPLSREERSFQKPLAYEFTMNKKLVMEIKKYPQVYLREFYYPDWLPFPVFKENHSINMLFRAFNTVMQESKLPANEFYQLVSTSPDRLQKLKPNWLACIYNPIGSILFSVSMPDFDKYIIRMHDMDGLITMINLKQKIKRENISRDDINSFLEKNRVKYSNPYTGQSIHWDNLEQTLWTDSPFNGFSTNKISLNIEFSEEQN